MIYYCCKNKKIHVVHTERKKDAENSGEREIGKRKEERKKECE